MLGKYPTGEFDPALTLQLQSNINWGQFRANLEAKHNQGSSCVQQNKPQCVNEVKEYFQIQAHLIGIPLVELMEGKYPGGVNFFIVENNKKNENKHRRLLGLNMDFGLLV